MSNSETTDWIDPAARLGATVVSLREALLSLHRQGRLVPWLQETATRVFLLEQARAEGLRVSAEELQHAADEYRRRHGLFSADETNAWLRERSLSLDDFEAELEAGALLEKLRHHIAGRSAEERFRASPADYDRLRLVVVLVPREDLAREVRSQVEEEGADLAEAAGKHSQHQSRDAGGKVGPIYRSALPEKLRESLANATVGTLVGPVASGEGFYLVRVEEVISAQLDAPTAAHLTNEAFNQWLREKLASMPFAVPLLKSLA